MTNRKINQQLRWSFEQAAPKTLPQDVVEACVPSVKTVTFPKHRTAVWRSMIAVAAVLALIVTGVALYRGQSAVPSASMTVALDVNPSILLEIDDNERIVAVNALNEDGTSLIGDAEWTGDSVDSTVRVLVQAMLQNGYLNENANSVLISVDSTDEERATALEQSLATAVQEFLADDGFEGAVLSQTLTADEVIRQKAADFGISCGKAMLISRIVELNPLKTFDDFAALSINDLNLLCKASQMPRVNASGSASDKAYIGIEAALQQALMHAELTPDQVTKTEIELDSEDGVMCYEVEFVYNGSEYEYEIDAATGEILQSDFEVDEEDDDIDEVVTNPTEEYLSETEIQSIVFAHAAVDTAAVIGCETELDFENGVAVYEVEFQCGDTEYEYCVDAKTGDILQSQSETDED